MGNVNKATRQTSEVFSKPIFVCSLMEKGKTWHVSYTL